MNAKKKNRISRTCSSPFPSLAVSPYTMSDHALAVVPSKKNLGDMVTDRLTWSLRTSNIVAKSNTMFPFLRRHFGGAYVGTDRKRSLYLSFVRSQLGNASEVWAPQSYNLDMKPSEGL